SEAGGGWRVLEAGGVELADGAQVVLVAHVAVDHVSDGLEAAMRMRRKARDVIVGIVRREVVEHEERVEPRPCVLPEPTAELDAGAVRGGNGFEGALQGARSHDPAEFGAGTP